MVMRSSYILSHTLSHNHHNYSFKTFHSCNIYTSIHPWLYYPQLPQDLISNLIKHACKKFYDQYYTHSLWLQHYASIIPWGKKYTLFTASQHGKTHVKKKSVIFIITIVLAYSIAIPFAHLYNPHHVNYKRKPLQYRRFVVHLSALFDKLYPLSVCWLTTVSIRSAFTITVCSYIFVTNLVIAIMYSLIPPLLFTPI